MQNFSLSKSYELAQLFSSLFPLFLYVAMVCRFVSRHKNFKKCFVFTNPFLSLCTSGSARMHSASLSVADFWMGSWFWYWIINFCCLLLPLIPFFLFGFRDARFLILDVLFWFRTTLYCNKSVLFVWVRPKAIPLCVLGTQAVPWARPALQRSQEQIAQKFQTRKWFPALCGQLFDHVPGHESHP